MGAGLTYLNFVVGVLCMFAYQPVQDWLYRRGTLSKFPPHALLLPPLLPSLPPSRSLRSDPTPLSQSHDHPNPSLDAAKRSGRPRPEARFLTSLLTVWLFPLSLFWVAFTSDGSVSWVSPLFAGGILGFCNPLLWLAMLNYITDSYPSVAASAIAAFSLPSFTIAAALVHAGIAMFENMTTTWAVSVPGLIFMNLFPL